MQAVLTDKCYVAVYFISYGRLFWVFVNLMYNYYLLKVILYSNILYSNLVQ